MLIAVCLLVLPSVILAGAWRLGGVSALEDDLLYYLPIRQYIGERIQAGELPMWNPLVGIGASLAADPQSGLWYPPTYLFAALPPLVTYPVTIILHFALAGWGMYRFLRALRRDWQAAFVGALAFEFCGYLIAHRAHLTIFEATAWVPWILYGWQRFADSGRYRHFALAVVAFGLQMLVQHTQVSIMTVVLVSAYAAFVLLPLRMDTNPPKDDRLEAGPTRNTRWRLLWQFPLGMMLGAGLAAIQTLPTLLHLSQSGRATPTYATFVENSWVPSSAMMMLFPMLFGNRTPTFWGQEWWGFSHFCEQFAFGSVIMLALAIASITVVRTQVRGRLYREVLFWWGASLVVLVIALGDATPAGRWLFHVPVYRNLRVPARWILVWSLAMPVLGSAVITAIRRGGATGERVTVTLRIVGTRFIPVAAAICLLVLFAARLSAGRLEEAFGQRWGAATMLAGLRSAVRIGNPALIWPLVVMFVSVAALLNWTRRRDGRSLVLLVAVMLVDFAGVAAFVDVDWTTYRREQLMTAPPLAEAIAGLKPDAGHRLLVPRYQADYRRPVEVLWPQTNMRHGIPTFNAYGPFWPRANRLLFRFMPWGSSEGMLELLRNRGLCEAMGIRFIAARTPEELAIVRAAMAPAVNDAAQRIAGFDARTPVQYGQDLLLPVQIDNPGIYRLRFQAEPALGSASQWFVCLERPNGQVVGWTRRLEPVDLSGGPRTMEFLFECQDAPGAAFVRIKAENGVALSISEPTFGRAAETELGCLSSASQPDNGAGWRLRCVTSDGINLFELRNASPLVRFAYNAKPVYGLTEAVEAMQSAALGKRVDVYEWVKEKSPPNLNGNGRITYKRLSGSSVRAEVYSDMEALLIFNESFAAGWVVTIDGHPTEPLRVNAVVQGVALPGGGGHVVEWRYRPVGLYAGLAVSFAAALCLLTGGLLTVGKPCRTAGVTEASMVSDQSFGGHDAH